MSNISVLYLFSSENLFLVEVSINDRYQWLVLNGSKAVLALDYKSMHKKDSTEYREFIEGSLQFNENEGELCLLGRSVKLKRETPAGFSPEASAAIEDYLRYPVSVNGSVSFRPLKFSDVHLFKEWIQDPEVIRYSMTAFHRLASMEGIVSWFRSTIFDTRTYQLGIVDSLTHELIGYAGIASINEIDGNGEYFIFIGNRSYWGRGIASQVTKEIVQRGFEVLKLHRIFLTASSSNPGAVRAYEKAGFVHEGRMREAFYRNGNYSDKLVMGILRSEFNKTHFE